MHQKVVVVARLSPSNSSRCWKCGKPPQSLPFCEHCRALQDPPEGLSAFVLLGVPEALNVSNETLRARFYELANQLHPDRFSLTASPQEAARSVRWTTALNRAYQSLRDPVERSYYLLHRHGKGAQSAETKLPLDLAETYFELQDLLSEPEGRARMEQFRASLGEQLDSSALEWEIIAAEWDKASTSSEKENALGRLQQHLIKRRYLNSMISDLDLKLGNRGE